MLIYSIYQYVNMKRLTSLKMEEETINKLRVRAAQQKTTMASLVESAVNESISKWD